MGNRASSSVEPTADISLIYLRKNRQSLTQEILNSPIFGHNLILTADYREIVSTVPYMGKSEVIYTGIPTNVGQAVQLYMDAGLEKKFGEERTPFVPVITVSFRTYSAILDLRLGLPPLLQYGTLEK